MQFGVDPPHVLPRGQGYLRRKTAHYLYPGRPCARPRGAKARPRTAGGLAATVVVEQQSTVQVGAIEFDEGPGGEPQAVRMHRLAAATSQFRAANSQPRYDPSRPIVSRVRCIALFGQTVDQTCPPAHRHSFAEAGFVESFSFFGVAARSASRPAISSSYGCTPNHISVNVALSLCCWASR